MLVQDTESIAGDLGRVGSFFSVEDKSSQPKDIQRAKEFWTDWKRSRNETS